MPQKTTLPRATAVRVSGDLVGAARDTAVWSGRSVAGQIEHWAMLGRAIDAALPAAGATVLKKLATRPAAEDSAHAAAQVLGVLVALRQHIPSAPVAEALRSEHEFRFESDPANPDRILRVDRQGVRTPGRMVKRKFIPDPAT